MKQLVVILSIAVALFGFKPEPVHASGKASVYTVKQRDDSYLEKAKKNYVKALQSDNSGLIESAIFNSLMLTVKHPDFNISTIEAELKKLAVNSNIHTIRYKAYLALTFIDNRDEFKGAKELAKLMNYQSPDDFFSYLDSEIKSRLLTINH